MTLAQALNALFDGKPPDPTVRKHASLRDAKAHLDSLRARQQLGLTARVDV